MKATELIKRYLSGERQFTCVSLEGVDLSRANLLYANLENANLLDANLYNANLENANLINANLRRAYLYDANLINANLINANLKNANLNANLRFANLESADLSDANLSDANLEYANLENANLKYADLRNANLDNANLDNANLENAYLENTNLKNANLTGTILDPWAKIPKISDEEIISAGLEIHGEFVAGYRTTISQHIGYQEYIVGEEYRAPVFSVDKNTPCHPGIYLASKEWLLDNYGSDCEIVRCFCRRDELIHAGNKWRAKRIRVIEG